MFEIRKASKDDFETVMSVYRIAQDYMIRSGNPTQWGHFYPEGELIESDIAEGICRVICDGTMIRGVFALIENGEPLYRRIEGGVWLNDEPYLTIHRIASDGQAHGIVRCAADHCKAMANNIRIDTHEDNRTMQKQLEKCGFVKCGTIYLANGSPRIAYHWTAE